jgi:N-acetyl sugar amidotransferase
MLFRCRRCLYPNTKPDLHFNAEGICSACQAYDNRPAVDWAQRKQQFLDFVSDYRGKTHDVIVACSGGKDSTAQIVKCLELGLKPLAVTATTDHLSDIGRRNLDNVSRLCDHVEVTPNKLTRARISKFALQEVGDISWCEHHLIWSVPAREAVQRNIPIVIYGENPQNEYGAGPAGSEKQNKLTKAWIDEFGGLLGLRLSDMADILNIADRDLDVYRYPKKKDGEVHALFLGSYFPWDGFDNYEVAKRHGFESYHTDVEGSLFSYENLDNAQTGLHDYVRWLKFGYGRATDIASTHIRRGRLTREEAFDMVCGRDGAFPFFYLGVRLEDILRRIGMSVSDFHSVCERFTNAQVVEWALRPESYQSFYGPSTDASKESSSTRAVA